MPEGGSGERSAASKGGWRERLAVFSAGVLFCLVALEASLWGLGLACHAWTDPAAASGQKRVILCVGDSFTWGAGARIPDESWPRQLADLLEAKYPGQYAVINRGQPGKNSTQLLDALPAFLESAHPHLVILLAGGANNWNLYGRLGRNRSLPERLAEAVGQLRVVRLGNLLCLHTGQALARTEEAARKRYLGWRKRRFQAGIRLSEQDLERAREACQRGAGFLQRGDFDGALACFQESTAINPWSQDGYNGAGDAMAGRGRADEALAWYQRGIEANPWESAGYVRVGDWHHSRRHGEALSWYEEAVARDPGNLELLERVVASLAHTRRAEEARKWLARLAAAGDESTSSYVVRATILEDLEDYDEAIACTLRAVELGFDAVQAHRSLGNLHRRKGEPEKAVECFRQALAARPDDCAVMSDLATTYLAQGRFDDAIQWYQRTASQAPGPAAENLGRVYQAMGRPEEAARWYRQAIQLNPAAAGPLGSQVDSLERQAAAPVSAGATGARPEALARTREEFRRGRAQLSGTEAWVQDDLLQMIRLCRRRRVPVLMHTYPGDRMSAVIEKVAMENHVPLVDHEPVFVALPDRAGHFVPDGHCNGRGYGVMAADLFPRVVDLCSREGK